MWVSVIYTVCMYIYVCLVFHVYGLTTQSKKHIQSSLLAIECDFMLFFLLFLTTYQEAKRTPLILFFMSMRTGKTLHFKIFSFRFSVSFMLHACMLCDDEERLEEGSGKRKGVATKLRVGVYENRLYLAIFGKNTQGTLPYLCLQSIFFSV